MASKSEIIKDENPCVETEGEMPSIQLEQSSHKSECGEREMVMARGPPQVRQFQPIDINSCSISQLKSIPGVGAKTALFILKLRETMSYIDEESFVKRVRGGKNLCQYVTFSGSSHVDGVIKANDKSVGTYAFPPPMLPNSVHKERVVRPKDKRDDPANFDHEAYRHQYLDGLRQASQHYLSRSFPQESEDVDAQFNLNKFRYERDRGDNNYGRERGTYGEESLRRERRDEERTRTSSLPRTITFDGREDWRAFRCKFMSFVACQRWSDRMTRDQLCWCLTGTASEYFSRLVGRDPEISSGEVLDKLEKRFDMRDLPETSQMLFNSACQAQKESVVEWADRILRLALNAYPELDDIYVYRQSIMRFCQGLADKEAGHFVLMTRPKSLDEALDKVRWYQHADQVIYAKGKGVRQVELESTPTEAVQKPLSVCRTGMQYTKENKGPSRPVSPKRVQFASEEKVKSLESKVEHLQEQMTAVLEGISSLKLMMRTTRSRSRSPSGCFKCGKQGHFARECPSTTQKVNQVEDLGNSSGSEE